jgi:5-methylcytosine-specific restriction endonuclease McrA
MANTKRFRTIRRRLFDADPHCHWCHCRTVWWVKATNHKNKPPNAATLDHLISRLNPLRYKMPSYPKELFVLACQSCNHKRGVQEDIALRHKAHWNSREELKKVLTDPELIVQFP